MQVKRCWFLAVDPMGSESVDALPRNACLRFHFRWAMETVICTPSAISCAFRWISMNLKEASLSSNYRSPGCAGCHPFFKVPFSQKAPIALHLLLCADITVRDLYRTGLERGMHDLMLIVLRFVAPVRGQ